MHNPHMVIQSDYQPTGLYLGDFSPLLYSLSLYFCDPFQNVQYVLITAQTPIG